MIKNMFRLWTATSKILRKNKRIYEVFVFYEAIIQHSEILKAKFSVNGRSFFAGAFSLPVEVN